MAFGDTTPPSIPVPITQGGTGATTASAARTALGSTATGDAVFIAATAAAALSTLGGQPLDSDLTALAAQAGTNTVPVRTGAGTISEQTFIGAVTPFTCTVTLVGGAGNTVPVYVAPIASYMQFGKACHVWIYKNGDGGAEGAGSGQYNMSLPITAATVLPFSRVPIGAYLNNAATSPLFGSIANGGATTISLEFLNSTGDIVTFTGVQQNNATRQVAAYFCYQTA